MLWIRRFPAVLFGCCLILALAHCGRRGSPSGGPKDETPPVLERAEPANRSTDFTAERIRLYFDEYIRLQDLEKQLIVSPPLKYQPEISPMGGTSKYLQIEFQDTLLENTTYTLNFGQSVVDNNEGNPFSLLTYVFSTGPAVDSLSLTGAVADAYKRSPDPFISVMLYQLDSAYTDSAVYKQPPYYLTNTLDSAVIFRLENLKAGQYRLLAIRDEAKNNIFNQNADKIGFVDDTITLPTDSTYLLRLFKEIPDYSVRKPTFAASNRILFGYTGDTAPELEVLTPLEDSVRTLITREPGKDSLNFWFTPLEKDSLIFVLHNPKDPSRSDTLSVKPLDVAADTLRLSWSHRGEVVPLDSVFLQANLPLTAVDTSRFTLTDQDTLSVPLRVRLDTLGSRVYLDFDKEPSQIYNLELLPGGLTDFFGGQNDTLRTRWAVGSQADHGILRIRVEGTDQFPLLVELTDREGKTLRSKKLEEPAEVLFNWLLPDTYRIRVVFDANANGRWDTGSYSRRVQPERVAHYPAPIEIRANWEKVETFTILE